MKFPGPSNREQDFSKSRPPQARFPHKDKAFVASGMSPILQLRPDFGLKISTVLKRLFGPALPPTVRIPACKHSAVLLYKYDIIVLPSIGVALVVGVGVVVIVGVVVVEDAVVLG